MTKDCFISGWEEGGELNALISVKTKNKAKSTHIKAAIEGRLGTPALSGKVSGSVDMENDDTFSESETTISALMIFSATTHSLISYSC